MKDVAILPLPLTTQESCDLAYYEGVIQEGLKTFYDVGKALIAIRNRKLYRSQYRTFEDYCREKWDISRPRAYQLIDAANIREDLSTNVDMLPEKEAQARALKAAPPEQRQEVWQKAVDSSNGTQPTAKQIKHVIQMEIPILEPEKEKEEPAPGLASPQVFVDRQLEPQTIDGVEIGKSYHIKGYGECIVEKTYMFDDMQRIWIVRNRVNNRTHHVLRGDILTNFHELSFDIQQQLLKENIAIKAEEGRRIHQEFIEKHQEPKLPQEEPPASISIKTCDFCEQEYPDSQLFAADHSSPMICGGCARKALFALLNIDSYGDFEWYGRDRDKIMRAGLRLFRVNETQKALKEYTPANSSIIEGIDITWGSWKTCESFNTKKALKARIKELETEPTIIFENRL